MGIMQAAQEIEQMHKELKELLGIKDINIQYIKSEQAITVKKGKK